MAGLGDTTPNGRRITPADLRVECQFCGGYKRTIITEAVTYPTINHTSKTLRDIGPCAPCGGAGIVFPRKVHK